MNSRHLVDRFAEGRDRGERMVLVTVYETLGSTYSKAGSRMLIMPDGRNEGLVSGGCLESDLAERAAALKEAGAAVAVTYDLRDEADELFGLGVGCNGLIRVLLQALSPDTGFEPMASIAEALLADAGGALATVIDSEAEGLAPGAALVRVEDQERFFRMPSAVARELAADLEATLESGQARLAVAAGRHRVLFAPLAPIPRVLILGAGLDAVPLVNVLAELGWRVTVADHRSAYLARNGFARAERCQAVRPETLRADLPTEAFDAIVVMSHHLLTDREYLRQLASGSNAYVGLLGPPARKQRLLDDLGDEADDLATRLRGPVGLDIGADSAATIAVSVAAEIQRVLATGA